MLYFCKFLKIYIPLIGNINIVIISRWRIKQKSGECCIYIINIFSDRVSEFHAIGAEVVGASVDSQFTHLAWTKTPRKEGGLGKMQIPLIADLTKGIY